MTQNSGFQHLKIITVYVYEDKNIDPDVEELNKKFNLIAIWLQQLINHIRELEETNTEQSRQIKNLERITKPSFHTKESYSSKKQENRKNLTNDSF